MLVTSLMTQTFATRKWVRHTLWLAILPSFLPPSLPSSITKRKNSVHSLSIATHVPAGDCIGESFSSPDRFPVIPPFGAPELSGIYLITLLFLYIHKIIGSVSTGLSYKLSRSTNYYTMYMYIFLLTGWTVDAKANPQHPAGAGGPSPSLTIPLISYRTWLTNPNTATRYIYVYPFSHLYQLDVHHIPISGAKVMVSSANSTVQWLLVVQSWPPHYSFFKAHSHMYYNTYSSVYHYSGLG